MTNLRQIECTCGEAHFWLLAGSDEVSEVMCTWCFASYSYVKGESTIKFWRNYTQNEITAMKAQDLEKTELFYEMPPNILDIMVGE